MKKRRLFITLMTAVLLLGTTFQFALAQNITDMPSTKDKGIRVDMFDYDGDSSDKLTLGINEGKTLLFGGDDSLTPPHMNRWTGNPVYEGEGGPLKGIVADRLVNGFPVLKDNGESLDYLFSEGHRSVDARLDCDGMFKKDADGYYYYSSSANFAELDTDLFGNSRFNIYDEPGRYDSNNNLVSDPGARFMPFNTKALIPESSSETPNFYFGMQVDVDFVMPENGQIKNSRGETEDMVFQFLGDDDVWVFIDDRLVLDLGGIHDRVGGSINFNSGLVGEGYGYKDRAVDDPLRKGRQHENMWASVFGEKGAENKFEGGTSHTLKFFYLERGAGASNCAIKFNMPPIPDNSLMVSKSLEGTGQLPAGLDGYIRNLDYTFDAEKSTGGDPSGEAFISAGTHYQIWKDGQDTGKQGTVADDGTFTLKAGEMAVFPDLLDPNQPEQKFVVKEIMPENCSGQYDDIKFDINSSQGLVTQGINKDQAFTYLSPEQTTRSDTNIKFRNQLKLETLSTLRISKEAEADSGFDSSAPFDVKVTVDGQPAAGTRFQVEGSDVIRTSDSQGIVKIKDGETLLMKDGMLIGNSFKVEEVNVPELCTPVYSGTITYDTPGQAPETLTGKKGISGTIKDVRGDAEVKIENTDSRTPASEAVDVRKVLQGRDWTDGDSFGFTLEAADSVTKSAVQAGTVVMPADAAGIEIDGKTSEHVKSFGDITFKKPGTYRFTVKEELPEGAAGDKKNGVKYDRTEKTVTITVRGNGQALEAAAEPASLTFTNVYSPDRAVLSMDEIGLKKVLDGRKMTENDRFSFQLRPADGKALPDLVEETKPSTTVDNEGFYTGVINGTDGSASKEGRIGDLIFTAPGVYEYDIKEMGVDGGSIKLSKAVYRVTVTVTDDLKGKLSVKSDMRMIMNDKGEKVTGDDGKGTPAGIAQFTNRYTPEDAVIWSGSWARVQKELEGRQKTPDDIFEFEIKDHPDNPGTTTWKGGNTLRLPAPNGSYNESFGKGFIKPDPAQDPDRDKVLVFRYYVTEKIPAEAERLDGITYSKAEYLLTFKVKHDIDMDGYVVINPDYGTSTGWMKQTKDDSGKAVVDKNDYASQDPAVFTNNFTPDPVTLDGSKALKVEKSLTGRDIAAGDTFTFSISAEEGAPLPAAKTVTLKGSDKDEAGNIKGSFGNIEFPEAGSYTYTIKETATNAAGVTLSKAEYRVSAEVVADRETGVLSVDTTGMTRVKDDSGKTVEEAAEAAAFTNKYAPQPTELNGSTELKVKKILKGRDINPKDRFTFRITPDRDTYPVPDSSTITLSGTDRGSFGNIEYSDEGTYTYTITETGKNEKGMTISGAEYSVSVKATDDLRGGYDFETSITKVKDDSGKAAEGSVKEAVFTNTYQHEDFTYSGKSDLRIKKLFKTGGDIGRFWEDEDIFSFDLKYVDENGREISDPDPAVIEIGDQHIQIGRDDVDASTGDGFDAYGHFGDIVVHEPGTYRFVITEQIPEGDHKGIVYETDPVEITLVIVDDGEGRLIKSDDSVDPVNKEFTNTYTTEPLTVSGKTHFRVEKKIDGRDFKDSDTFTFKLKSSGIGGDDSVQNPMPEDGDTLILRGSDADVNGQLTGHFGDITFTEAGTYYYEVTEVRQDGAGMTYSLAKEDLIVDISNKGDGTYKVDTDYRVRINDDGEDMRGALYFDDRLIFTNKYRPEPQTISGAADLKVKKALTGREMKEDDQFTFSITGSEGAPVPEKTTLTLKGSDMNTAGETAGHFGDITFTKGGIYKYIIKETGTDKNGVTLSDAEYEVTVNADDHLDGTMDVSSSMKMKKNDRGEASEKDAPEALFTNRYDAEDYTLTGSRNLKVSKTLTGRSWLDDDAFGFSITQVDAGGSEVTGDEGVVSMPEDISIGSGDVTETSGSGSGISTTAEKAFGDIVIGDPGTYRFLVKEKIPSGGDEGITYDEKEYTITLVVRDNGLGSLVAEVEGQDMTFTNDYDADPVTVTGAEDLKVEKTMKGRDMKPSDTFTFSIAGDSDGTPEPPDRTITLKGSDADSNGKIAGNFGNITYEKAGTYRYTIEETGTGEKGVTFSKAVYSVTVKVEDDNKGALKADVSMARVKDDKGRDASGQTSAAAFVNTYKAAPADLTGSSELKVEKTLSGRAMKETDSFTFSIEAAEDAPMPEGTSITLRGSDADENGKITGSFGDITYTEAGTYTYKIKETGENGNGITRSKAAYEVTVKVVDNEDGTLTVTPEMKQVKSDSGDKVSQDAGAAAFVNKYDAEKYVLSGETYLDITKVFTGKKWTGEKFTFDLTQIDDNGDAVTDDSRVRMPSETSLTLDKPDAGEASGSGTAVKAEASGTFGDIELKGEDTYRFLIRESIPDDRDGITYDEHSYIVNVTVTDNGMGSHTAAVSTEGSSTFTNTYVPEAGQVIGAEKTLEGRTLADEEFSFTIKAGEGQDDVPMPAITTVTNDAEGKIAFGEVRYNEPGEYIYLITEDDTDDQNITKDSSAVKVTVTASYDEETGRLTTEAAYEKDGQEGRTFRNIYTPQPVTFTGVGMEKTLVPVTGGESMPVGKGDFKFLLTPSSQNVDDPLTGPVTVPTDVNGAATFLEDLEYDAEGTYIYTVSEKQEGPSDGIIYDSSVYKITVTVKDVGGQLEAGSVIEKDGVQETQSMAFENKYALGKTSALIDGTKKLTGKAIEDGLFTFTIERVTEGAPLPEKTTAANVNETFAFDPIVFEEAGTYEYIVKEKAGKADGYTYDKKSYPVTVVVEETTYEGSEQIKLTNTVRGADDIVFNNAYEPLPLELKGDTAIRFQKELTGRHLSDGEFTFELKDMNGETVKTAAAAADGSIAFEGITIDEEGTYRYTVSEKAGNLGGVTYDDTVYGVELKVEDRNGRLAVTEEKYTVEGQETDERVFRNAYAIENPAVIAPGAVKALKGRQMKEGEFTFQLMDGRGDVVESAVNDARGTVNFSQLTFDEKGKYVYTVSEKKGGDPSIIYDDSVYEITIDVRDDLRGTLIPSIEKIEKDGETVSAARFINEVKADETVPADKGDGSGTKTGDGQNMAIFLLMLLMAGTGLGIFAVKRRI